MVSVDLLYHFGFSLQPLYDNASVPFTPDFTPVKNVLSKIKCLDQEKSMISTEWLKNKAGYTATEVACARVGAIFEVTRLFRQELQYYF